MAGVDDREKTSQVLSTNDTSYRQLEGQLEGVLSIA